MNGKRLTEKQRELRIKRDLQAAHRFLRSRGMLGYFKGYFNER